MNNSGSDNGMSGSSYHGTSIISWVLTYPSQTWLKVTSLPTWKIILWGLEEENEWILRFPIFRKRYSFSSTLSSSKRDAFSCKIYDFCKCKLYEIQRGKAGWKIKGDKYLVGYFYSSNAISWGGVCIFGTSIFYRQFQKKNGAIFSCTNCLWIQLHISYFLSHVVAYFPKRFSIIMSLRKKVVAVATVVILCMHYSPSFPREEKA